MKVKVTEYNVYHGAVRWRISTSIKLIPKHFKLDFTVFQISIFVTLKMKVMVMIYNTRSGAIRWKISDFLSDGNSNICLISHYFRDINVSIV